MIAPQLNGQGNNNSACSMPISADLSERVAILEEKTDAQEVKLGEIKGDIKSIKDNLDKVASWMSNKIGGDNMFWKIVSSVTTIIALHPFWHFLSGN